MAELADAYGSGPYESNFMQVQVLLSAPKRESAIEDGAFFFCSKQDLNLKKARTVKQNSSVNCFVGTWCVVISSVPSRGMTSRQGLRSKTGSCYPHQKEKVLSKMVLSFLCKRMPLLVRGAFVLVQGTGKSVF